jgi:nitronate monooxygenase
MSSVLDRANAFCLRFDLGVPILLAPMAGVSAPSLSIAVANAGGLGACGVVLMQPDEITSWANEVRSKSNGAFQLNTWIPDPPPRRNPVHEAALRDFLGRWGPPVPPEAGDATPPDFASQCEAMLAAAPPIISSVMGLFPTAFVKRIKWNHSSWMRPTIRRRSSIVWRAHRRWALCLSPLGAAALSDARPPHCGGTPGAA